MAAATHSWVCDASRSARMGSITVHRPVRGCGLHLLGRIGEARAVTRKRRQRYPHCSELPSAQARINTRSLGRKAVGETKT
jgi:hypothetical protein